jgi:tetratricopeptide (TPR) repeat protein/tRNA A-37 threonylcarbamoyl transferase component Bud32
MNEGDHLNEPSGTLPLPEEPSAAPATATELATGVEPARTLPPTERPCADPAPTAELVGCVAPARTLSLSEVPSIPPAGETRLLPEDPVLDRGSTEAMPAFSEAETREVPDLAQFEILAELGHGGMGVVYKARHRQLNRILALKMIIDGRHAHFIHRARFLIEAEVVARLRHPNIVQIYDFGEAGGCPFVTLELLEGGSLADRLKGTTQPGRAAAGLIATLATAMHAAHEAGIVHRDLKPTNILFDRDGIPKIVDFGIAKRLEVEEGHTRTGQIMGTPSYMAPEQAQGLTREIVPATDIYALGAILYEMLTGRPPFKGTNPVSTLRQVVDDDLLPPGRIESRIARDLETICMKCLQKEPAKRYGTALELDEDLRRYLENRPIRARRTPLWELGAKWVRRRPAAATLLVLAMVAALVLVLASLHYDAQRKARARADRQALERRRVASERALEQAQARLLRNDWADGRYILGKLITDLRGESRLDDIRGRAERLLEQSEQKLQEDAEQRRARAQQREFVQHRNEAFFHKTRFTGLDLPTDVRATRAAAVAALFVFARPGPGDGDGDAGAWTFTPLPRALSQQEQAEIKEGCYELLLVLAEAVAEPLPGEDPVLQAERGLRLLDQAARLRVEPTPAWHRARALCLGRKGDEAAAARESDAADLLPRTAILDHFLAGLDGYQRQDWKTALSEFEVVLRTQPDHFWALCLGAIASLQTNQPAMATFGLNDCIRQEPGFAWLYVLRGFAAGQSAVQARTAARTLRIEDDSLEAAVEAHFDAAEDDYRRALELLAEKPNAELRWVAMVNRALMRFHRGQFEESVADLEEAIRLDDTRYLAFANLAEVLQREKWWDEAIERFTQAIRLKPRWAPLYRGRAAVQQTRDDQTPEHRAAALRDLEDAIRYEKPGSPIVASDHTRRGELLRADGRFEEALAACDAALKIAPDFDTAHRLRVKVLLDLDRPDEVIRSCDGALARGKPWPDLYEIRGLARASRGDYAGAIEDYSYALLLRPGQPRVLSARGLAYLFSDAPRPALRDFDAALRLDSSDGEAHGGRGLALVRLGDHRAGIAEAEVSLGHGPPSARRAYNAARIYATAAVAAAAEVHERGRPAVTMVERCQDRAVTLLKLALERTPVDRRTAFWQDFIAADPAFRPLQRRLRSLQPAAAMGSWQVNPNPSVNAIR